MDAPLTANVPERAPGRTDERRLVAFQIFWTVALFGLCVLILYLQAGQTLTRSLVSHLVSGWDARWYLMVAAKGYTWNGIATQYQDVAFFPLYPLLVAGFRFIVGSAQLGGVILAVAFQGAAAVFLYRIYALVGERDQARRLTALYVLFPAGVFTLFVYPTSLMNALAFFAVYAYLKGWRGWAFAAAGAATAAGPALVALTVGLAVYDAITRPQGLLRRIPVYLLGFWGIVLFSVWLGIAVGAPLAFNTVQVAWHGPVPLVTEALRSVTLSPFVNGLLDFVRSPSERPLMYLQDTLVAMAFLAGLLYLVWKGEWLPLILAGAGFVVIMVFNAAPYDVPLSFTRLAYPFFFLLPMGRGIRRVLARRWASHLPLAFAIWSVVWIVIWCRGLWVE